MGYQTRASVVKDPPTWRQRACRSGTGAPPSEDPVLSVQSRSDTYDKIIALLVKPKSEWAKVSLSWQLFVEPSGVERANEERRGKEEGERDIIRSL